MITCQVNFEPKNVQIECVHGALLSEVLNNADVRLVSVCGGKGLCGKCRIKIKAGEVSHLTDAEFEHLSKREIAEGNRLACQVRVLSDIAVSIPPESISLLQKLHLAGREEVEMIFEPAVQECIVALNPPLPGETRSEWERLAEELKNTQRQDVTRADPLALRSLTALLSENNRQVRVSVRKGEVIDVRPPGKSPLGMAIDLGTTKIAAYLVDLENGGTLASEGIVNPQIAFGEDVISRLAYAMENGGTKLQQTVIQGLNELMKRLSSEPERIVEITLAGNTAMHHLFLGLPVKQLGTAPYLPAVRSSLEVKARDIGLCSAPGAYIYILPNLAGFIGADHTAMILATGIHSADKTVLGLDIGTNTEIVLAHGGKLMSTSCASGPAFEGGHITCGMHAARGAIEKVTIEESHVTVQTIDNTLPTGICGSGVLDAVAELRRTEMINRRGRLGKGPGVRQADTAREFVLVDEERSGTGKDIIITQKDINEIQLAKAAIRTGIEALLTEMSISWEEIHQVIIAGGFGTAINPASAIAIGMFPPLPPERFREVGNAAGIGAKLCLISSPQRAKADEISQRTTYLDLMSYPTFAEAFIRHLPFPEEQTHKG